MWKIESTDDFDAWFTALGDDEKAEVLAKVELLKTFGPSLKRPHADTLNGSRYANMKELRCRTSGTLARIAFAFDPLQMGILLCAGDKKGVSERAFYKKLIDRADKLYQRHLTVVEKSKAELQTLAKQKGEKHG